ncbi:hypothetical protein [Nonomuraea sp. NPDC049709]|uniref:hypothetical protein n=1 Tax=Nonomuraea sp. NPDC049709 TaxID=3154736 RepID=UPI0034207D70
MAYESGSNRFCRRCGSHVGTLAQCPRCRAQQTPQGAEPPATGDDPEPLRLRRSRSWRRPPALIGLVVAALALALTWWIVAADQSGPQQVQGAGQGRAPAPASPGAGTGTGTGASPGSSPETGPQTSPETSPGTGDGGTPSPSSRVARQQAEAMDELLSSSSSARSNLSEAITDATRCERGGVETIRDITGSRRDQLAAARALAVTALAGGTELKGALVDALDASYEADAAFLAWARRHVAAGCTGAVTSDRDYRLGLDRSEAAQKAKTRFVRAWRPIAETYHLTVWKPDQI